MKISKKLIRKINESFKWLIIFITKYLEDILILSGLIIIIKATFLLSRIAGIYCLGFVLLGLGIYFAKNPLERG